jgi:replicative DNA helicase|tara:strand:+ start:2084 stop:3547 length:1464 start_codon:yes stop_codon:yes gene_type:complete
MKDSILSDPSAERAVLAGLCRYGENAYLDIADILSSNAFTIDSNQIIYNCIKHIYEQNNTSSIDLASIYSAAQELGCSEFISSKEEALHIKAILMFPVEESNLRKFAVKIKKLEVAKTIAEQLKLAQTDVENISGTESINDILNIAESKVLDLGQLLGDGNNEPDAIGKNIEDYIKNLEENPIDQVGLSTGFPIYDKAIGGGLRRSTVNVIAARPKTGKTLLADNMGFALASQGIPVLNMDTEMTTEDHINRILAMMTEIDISNIETGGFRNSSDLKAKIYEATEKLKNTRLYYKPIAGKPFEEQVSIMRRWLIKEVGLNDDGTAKDCVIFYDYLKLMDSQGISQDMKEYQVLGFMMTQLHNFATKYKIPIVAFVQLNRDGITKESTDTASGSDRIIWLCSNFSIFKRKSDEEIAEDGPTGGNRKLLPVVSRHGAGLDDNDYINCHMKGWCAQITEGRTKLELANNPDKDFEINNNEIDEKEDIPFI